MASFEWSDLRVFLAIYRGRSVRAAAKLLDVSHSTVSRRLRAMEEQLGLALFARQPGGLVLTKTGESIVARAERVESELIGLERDLFGKDAALSGLIRISLPPHLAQHLVMPILATFSSQYPDLAIQIFATFDIADLGRRDADIAIRFKRAPDEHLVGHALPDFASAVYATREYLERHTFVGPGASARWIGWGSKRAFSRLQRETPFAKCPMQHHIADPSSHFHAVKSGMGFSHLQCFMADPDPDLVRVSGQRKVLLAPAWILIHPDIVTTERVRVCAQFLLEALHSREAQIRGERP